jgi:hypothetical protein
MPSTPLEQAIFATIRYWSLFDMPVTRTQLWRSLAHPAVPPSSLRELNEVLQQSAWLHERVAMKWGYYFLKGQEASVIRRLDRHTLAQHKWKLARRLVRRLRYVPFVRMIAGSGSLTYNNTHPDSDLDLFIVVRHGRIWTARLLLLTLAQLMGRRRKYWNVKAPDTLCLNHYVTDTTLLISPEIQTIYTAMQYIHFTVLSGEALYQRFLVTNRDWLKQWVTYRVLPAVPSVYATATSPLFYKVRYFFEQWLTEPIGDLVERVAERVQRRTIARHTTPGRAGRVMVSGEELAFHPDSKMAAITHQFLS